MPLCEKLQYVKLSEVALSLKFMMAWRLSQLRNLANTSTPNPIPTHFSLQNRLRQLKYFFLMHEPWKKSIHFQECVAD